MKKPLIVVGIALGLAVLVGVAALAQMLHWIGIAITLVSGLLGIECVRRRLQKKYRKATSRGMDRLLIFLLLVGVFTTTLQYVLDQRKSEAMAQEVDLLKFQDVASYSLFGHKSGAINGIRMVSTPIGDWCASFVSRSDGKLTWTCDEKSDALCREALTKVPNFPFAYFLLAISKKDRGDASWRHDAETALSIFSKTIKFSSHSSDHEQFLQMTKDLLATK